MKFTRMFLPIGQGAFYLERIDKITIIYDCGICYQKRNDVRVERLIDSVLLPNEEIDILFISHFDFDHVSKIPYLIKHHNIKRVVLPLLHNNIKLFISKVYKELNQSELSMLIDNPQQLFGTDTQIISIANSEEINIDDRIEPIGIESLTTGTIKNKSRIVFNKWEFVPYNHDYGSRSYKVNKSFNGININKLINDEKYFEKKRKLIKNIYTLVAGGINQNSMFLYSGPTEENIECNSYHFNCLWFRLYFYRTNNIGCIYTGDGDLNIVNISSVYSKYMNKVGTIQIPHHGDASSFNTQTFTKGHYICPISFGTDNIYGHPSPYVIDKLLDTGNIPVFITQNTSDMLISKN